VSANAAVFDFRYEADHCAPYQYRLEGTKQHYSSQILSNIGWLVAHLIGRLRVGGSDEYCSKVVVRCDGQDQVENRVVGCPVMV
jgi:hypothetical protein